MCGSSIQLSDQSCYRLFFVCRQILGLYGIGNNELGSFGPINGGLLAGVLLLNVPSMLLDLSSRRLGIDRFEGWSALGYILEEAQNTSMRQNLARYLQLLIDCAQVDIGLSEEVNHTARVSFFNNGQKRSQMLSALKIVRAV